MRLADTRTLGRLVRWRIPGTPADLRFRELFAAYPFVLLDEGDGFSVSGLCGRIWTLTRDYPRLEDPEAFRAWDRPGTVRVLFAHWVEPDADGRSALVSEARVRPTDVRAALALRALGRPHPDVRAPHRHRAADRGDGPRRALSARWPGPSPRSSPASSDSPSHTSRPRERSTRARSRPVRCWRAPGIVRRSAGTGTGSTCGMPSPPSPAWASTSSRPRAVRARRTQPRSSTATRIGTKGRTAWWSSSPSATTSDVATTCRGPTPARPPAKATHASSRSNPWLWPHHQAGGKPCPPPQFFSA